MSLRLNAKLLKLGMRITGDSSDLDRRSEFFDIEKTLIECVVQFSHDGRLASLLLSWIQVHGPYVIVEKLEKLARQQEGQAPGSTLWLSAVAAFAAEEGSSKWKKLAKKSKTPIYLPPKEITESAIALKGSISWLAKINFFAAQGVFRIREDDVLTREELIRRNPQYRNRYLFGPSWRSDIVTAIEWGMKTPAEISKKLGCSYEPANRVFREVSLVRGL